MFRNLVNAAPPLHGGDRRPRHGRARLVPPPRAADPQAAVNTAFNQFKTLKEGKNADYIPALAKVDPNLFGIALVTVDGKVYTAGDIKTEVSIQSISKVFTMAQVIQEQGLDAIEKRIGVDATGARSTPSSPSKASRRRRHRRAGDESARQPGRDFGDQHGEGRDRDAVWKKIIGFHNDFAGRR